MFGSDGTNQTDQSQAAPADQTYAQPAPMGDPAMSLPAVPVPPTEEQLAATPPPPPPPPADENAQLDSLAATPENGDDTPPTNLPSPSHDDVMLTPPSDDLMALKSQALSQLSPLVGHLEQTPEEKFKTTMMMIQAADNKDLIKVAYEAAQAITDEKIKAQALLDVINEINYFTQQEPAAE
jgi:hypothetical protein